MSLRAQRCLDRPGAIRVKKLNPPMLKLETFEGAKMPSLNLDDEPHLLRLRTPCAK